MHLVMVMAALAKLNVIKMQMLLIELLHRH